MGIADEFRLVCRKMFQNQSCEVSVFPQMKQILKMQSIDSVFGIIVHDLVGDKEWLMRVRCSKAVD